MTSTYEAVESHIDSLYRSSSKSIDDLSADPQALNDLRLTLATATGMLLVLDPTKADLVERFGADVKTESADEEFFMGLQDEIFEAIHATHHLFDC